MYMCTLECTSITWKTNEQNNYYYYCGSVGSEHLKAKPIIWVGMANLIFNKENSCGRLSNCKICLSFCPRKLPGYMYGNRMTIRLDHIKVLCSKSIMMWFALEL